MNNTRISNKIASVSFPGIHAVMARTRELQKQGADVIVLGQAVPDFMPPKEIHTAVTNALPSVKANFYTPDPGLLELREALTQKFERENCFKASPEQIFVTPGANGAYAVVIPAIADAGDEIILPSPFYMNHEMAITIAGCKAIEVATDEESDYALIPEEIEKAITPRTRAITLVSPNNPTGAVYSKENLERVVSIARKHNLYIISDEVYEHLTFPGVPHTSTASIAGASDITITIGSFSKSHALTGWRCGYLCVPSHLADSVLKVHDTFFICAPAISQLAAIEALKIGTSFLNPYREKLVERKNCLKKGVSEITHLKWREPRGALFTLLRYESELSVTSIAFDILEKAHVTLVPGAAFGKFAANHLRVSFGACEPERITEACERLKRYFSA